jgi:pilus assembly protein CpaB
MLARRLMIAFIAALMVAVPGTVWLARKSINHSAPAPAELRYVAASRSLEGGEALKPEDLSLVKWPAADPLVGAFATADQVAGRTALYPLASGQPILARYLAAAGSGVGLSGKIPAGMRAIALKSDEVAGVAGFLLPGTHVDALVTFRDSTHPEPTTAIVLQDAQVLAAGHQIQPDPEGKPVSVDVVTLLLTPRDSVRAVLASSQGQIHFVLRSGADHEQTDDGPVDLTQLFHSEPDKPMVARATLPSPPLPYVVETILGTKQSTESFR